MLGKAKTLREAADLVRRYAENSRDHRCLTDDPTKQRAWADYAAGQEHAAFILDALARGERPEPRPIPLAALARAPSPDQEGRTDA